MNKTIYRIMLCLSVCALLLLVFIGCKEQSGTKNDPVVTTEKVYEHEYQRILDDDGYMLVEDAVKVSPKKHLDKNYSFKSYKNFFFDMSKNLDDPYLFIGEKIKSETYVKDLGVFSIRCPYWDVKDNEAKAPIYYTERKNVFTVTTVRVDEVVTKYSSETEPLAEGTYIYFIEYSYALPGDVVCYDGVYYNYEGLLNPQDESYETRTIISASYYYGSLYNAIPEGKSLFFVDMNDMRISTGDKILRSNLEVNFGNENFVQEDWYFISLEENLMKETLQTTEPHPFIVMAQDDYARSKEEK